MSFTEKNKIDEAVDPQLSNLLDSAIRAGLLETHTCIPGHIVSYNVDNNMAKVQVDIKRKYKDDQITIPVLEDVPVMSLNSSGGKAFISMPISKGDEGLIFFSERSMDDWKSNGGVVNNKQSRIHDYSDAMFLPMLKPEKKAQGANPSEIVVNMGDCKLTLKEGGGFLVENKNTTLEITSTGKMKFEGVSDELLSSISSFMHQVINSSMLVEGSAGPYPILITSTWTAPSKLLLEQKKAKFDTLKI